MYRKIQKMCKKHKVSVNRLESELGFTRGSIFKWDAHRPSVDKVKKVADFFGVKIEDLI